MKSMERYEVEIGGQRLMMHNDQLANPFNEYTQALAKVSKKRGKSLEDHEEVARIEFQGGLYFDDKAGPVMPAHCLHKMMIEGAKRRKLGKKFAESIIVEGDSNPVLYEGPRTRDGLWKARMFDQRLAGVGGKARVLRTRPLFRDWTIRFVVKVTDPGAVNPEDIRNALEAAEVIGLGDGRPLYAGQFTVRSFAKVK